MKVLNIFFREKPLLILLIIDNKYNYASLIAKKVDVTYSHCVKILKGMEQAGIIEATKVRRIKEIILTDMGRELKNHLAKAKTIMEEK